MDQIQTRAHHWIESPGVLQTPSIMNVMSPKLRKPTCSRTPSLSTEVSIALFPYTFLYKTFFELSLIQSTAHTAQDRTCCLPATQWKHRLTSNSFPFILTYLLTNSHVRLHSVFQLHFHLHLHLHSSHLADAFVRSVRDTIKLPCN